MRDLFAGDEGVIPAAVTAAPEACHLWHRSVGLLLGLCVAQQDDDDLGLGVCYLHKAVLPDPEEQAYQANNTYELPVSDIGSVRLQTRAVGLALAAVVFDEVTRCDDALAAVVGRCVAAVDAIFDDHADHPDATYEVDARASIRRNWLPFSRQEATYLAFGGKVEVDVLPAVTAAVRAQQPGFGIHSTDDLRLL